MKTNKEIAKEIVLSYFNELSNKDRLGVAGFKEIFNIRTNDEALLEHIKALKNIFEKAIKEMEEK